MQQESKIIRLEQQRRNLELNQIKSILNDFSKTKTKCIELSKFLNEEMRKEDQFQNLQKSIIKKMDLLDLSGLVNLKNQLVRASTQIFQIQRELRYKKERQQTKRMMVEVQGVNDTNFSTAVQSSVFDEKKSEKPIIDDNVQSLINQLKKSEDSSSTRVRNKKLEIPLYHVKNQTNQNKLDRISKYIASLKRNIKLNSQTFGYKWRIKEFLMQDSNYLELRKEIQKYQMREQQIDQIFSQAVEKRLRQYLSKFETVQTNPNYRLIKVYKNKNKSSERLNNIMKSVNGLNTQNIINQKINNQQDLLLEKRTLSLINDKPFLINKIQEDFSQIEKQLQKQTQNFTKMISILNHNKNKGSENILMLRQKRKKQEEIEDNIWDELQKIQ